MKYLLSFYAFLFLTVSSVWSQAIPGEQIDWPSFISSNDIVFNTMTSNWGDGVFTGNGLLGNMIYLGSSGSTIRMDIGRTDLRDHRNDHPDNVYNNLYDKARLPVGYFTFQTVGTVNKNSSKVGLWNAETSGNMITSQGTLDWRSLTFSQSNVILFEAATTGSENNFIWKWNALESKSPRTTNKPADYLPNPAPVLDSVKDDIHFCLQPMTAGGAYVTAWKEQVSGNIRRYFISVGYSQSSQNAAVDEALGNIESAVATDLTTQINLHRDWWHQFYQKSFISIPDKRMEKFYWAQMYKLGSAIHPGKPALDLMGPWFASTPWPNYWFNLNIELAYSPLYKSNHLELSSTLVDMLNTNVANLIKNVPAEYQYNAAGLGRNGSSDMIFPLTVTKSSNTPPATEEGNQRSEVGDLTWILYYYWEQYKYSMDENVLNTFLPLLNKSINYYLDIISTGTDGYYHTPYTFSPEYTSSRDCNYDLSLLRWGLMTLLKLDTNAISTVREHWQDVLDHLVPYPADGNILRIGADAALTSSHRHYSHLLMIYPLQTMNWEQPGNRDMISASIGHWQGLTGQLQGYSFTGSSSMYSMMGLGNKAVGQLNTFLNNYVKNNTFYTESGPVIETPLAAAASLQELLLQSRNDTIYVFHAVPDAWDKAAIKDMLTEGAFKVSGVLENGKAKWIHVQSTAGGICNINVGKASGKLQAMGDITTPDITFVSDTVVSFSLAQGKQVWLYANETDLATDLTPVVDSTIDENVDPLTDKVILPDGGPYLSLIASADTYIYGNGKDSNFGGADSLYTKNGGTPYNRTTFVKFDLSGISLPGVVKKVYLKLSARKQIDLINTTASGKAALLANFQKSPFFARYLSNDNWTESGLTWNNFTPASLGDTSTVLLDQRLGSSIDFHPDYTVVDGSPLLFDVTAQVNKELSGDKIISLVVPSNTSYATLTTYSKEAVVPDSLKPQLLFYVETAAPVKLAPLTAAKTGNSVRLHWQTYTELNALHFVINHSIDGYHFNVLDSVPAVGNNNTIHNYTFVDTRPAIGDNYYQLKEVDVDGYSQYSNIAVVKNENVIRDWLLYPNPVSKGSNITIELNKLVSGKINIRVLDMNGRLCISRIFTGNTFRLRAAFPPGVYMVQLLNEKGILIGNASRLVIQ